MTPWEQAELKPLIGAAFDARGTAEFRSTITEIERWWLDRPFKPWDSRPAREQRALRTAARVDALARLLGETA